MAGILQHLCHCVCVFKEHSASHDSLMSSCPHRALGHTPSVKCHLMSGSICPHRVFSCLFLLPFFLSEIPVLDRKSQAKEELRYSLSLCCPSALYYQPDFFSDHLLFQFNFRKFLLGLKGERESPVILTPELSPCMCALYTEGTLQNSQPPWSLQPVPILTGTNGEDVTRPPFCGTGAFEACLRNGWGTGPA